MFNKWKLKRTEEQLIEDISTYETTKSQIINQCQIESNRLDTIIQNIKTAEQTLNFVTKSIEKSKLLLQGYDNLDDIGFEYTPTNTSVELEEKIDYIQEQIAQLVGQGLFATDRVYAVNGSKSQGEQFQKAYCENLLIGFNAYFNKKRKSITIGNLDKTIELLTNKFNAYNKKAKLIGSTINQEYLSLCINLLKVELDLKLAKAEEKEQIKEEKRKLKEQETMLKEAEKAKAEIQKERRMYEQSLAKALTEQERKDFEAKLKEIDKREADVDYRINNQRAGYLYVTASKAMPGMTKIGVTRRINPLVRIQELSTAGVPYPFVCYGLVFDDNVFDLETRVHEFFDTKRVNKENKHKEFFYISPEDAIEVLQKDFKCKVYFMEGEDDEQKI